MRVGVGNGFRLIGRVAPTLKSSGRRNAAEEEEREGRVSTPVSRMRGPRENGYSSGRDHALLMQGRLVERGPYLYFYYHEGGKQRNMDEPEAVSKNKRMARTRWVRRAGF